LRGIFVVVVINFMPQMLSSLTSVEAGMFL